MSIHTPFCFPQMVLRVCRRRAGNDYLKQMLGATQLGCGKADSGLQGIGGGQEGGVGKWYWRDMDLNLDSSSATHWLFKCRPINHPGGASVLLA